MGVKYFTLLYLNYTIIYPSKYAPFLVDHTHIIQYLDKRDISFRSVAWLRWMINGVCADHTPPPTRIIFFNNKMLF